MNLRSASTAIVPTAVKVNSFIELRSDDPAAKPWLARIVQTKLSPITGEVEEVECEWLWHPRESVRDFSLGYAASTYGSREVFLGGSSGESDWNPVASIKWAVYVFPLETYKTISANGFQVPQDDSTSQQQIAGAATKSSVMVLDPNRCWYYRQSLEPETHKVTPELELTVHRPNPAFHEWCRANGVPVACSLPLDTADSTNPPPRVILVPENPERIYYKCTTCCRRFETKLGDCCDPQTVNDPKHFRLKIQISTPDVEFMCPLCDKIAESNRGIDSPPPAKRARGAADQRITRSQSATATADLFENDTDTPVSVQRQEEMRREERKKQTRYERFNDVFKRAIDESSFDSSQSTFLQYSDPKTLCEEFFDQFEAYSNEARLNAKMAHQQLHELFQNLKRENNIDLRRRIITGELSLRDLVRSNAKDLAPESLKKRREAEAKKYFTQQVLLQSSVSTSQLIRKTHKGLEAVAPEEDALTRSPPASQSSPSPTDATSADVMGLQQFEDHSLALPEINLAQYVKATREKRGDLGGIEQELVSIQCRFELEWEKSTDILGKDTQLSSPVGLFGVPNREQSMNYVKAKLANVYMHDK